MLCKYVKHVLLYMYITVCYCILLYVHGSIKALLEYMHALFLSLLWCGCNVYACHCIVCAICFCISGLVLRDVDGVIVCLAKCM